MNITVEQLLKLCEDQLEKGNGRKFVAISNNNDTIGFHMLRCGFCPSHDYMLDIEGSNELDSDSIIVLG